MNETDVLTVEVRGSECDRADRMLRALDRTRRDWSTQRQGVPGMFAGFETLAMNFGSLDEEGRVVLSARSVYNVPGSQMVELSATYWPPGFGPVSGVLVAQGRGRNLTPVTHGSRTPQDRP